MNREPQAPGADVVMKFGGSSLATVEHIQRVAKIVAARAASARVVVVVSAMGKTTDALVAQAHALSTAPNARELDMLLSTGERQSMAMLAISIAAEGVRAMSLTGSQVGIITDHQHGRARVVEVRPFRIVDELDAGHDVIVIGGFQGVSYKREVTTLGRGGSDTTAVALAAALGADCEIYSDVDGVFSADPRVVDDPARILDVDYETMGALSRAGARVLHASAVELAAARGVVIHARATHGSGGGTTIRPAATRRPTVQAVTSDRILFTTLSVDGAQTSAVSDLLARCASSGLRSLTWTQDRIVGWISCSQRDDARAQIEKLQRAREGDAAHRPHTCRDAATVSLVGPDIHHVEGVQSRSFRALSEAGIHPWRLETATNCVRIFVDATEGDRAVRCLHALWIETAAAAASPA